MHSDVCGSAVELERLTEHLDAMAESATVTPADDTRHSGTSTRLRVEEVMVALTSVLLGGRTPPRALEELMQYVVNSEAQQLCVLHARQDLFRFVLALLDSAVGCPVYGY